MPGNSATGRAGYGRAGQGGPARGADGQHPDDGRGAVQGPAAAPAVQGDVGGLDAGPGRRRGRGERVGDRHPRGAARHRRRTRPGPNPMAASRFCAPRAAEVRKERSPAGVIAVAQRGRGVAGTQGGEVLLDHLGRRSDPDRGQHGHGATADQCHHREHRQPGAETAAAARGRRRRRRAPWGRGRPGTRRRSRPRRPRSDAGVRTDVARRTGRRTGSGGGVGPGRTRVGLARVRRPTRLGSSDRRSGYSTRRRPENARPRVTSSAYSRSPPTGRPLASRVTTRSIGATSRAR